MIQASTQLITPETALEMLTTNTSNRKVRPAVVARYAGAMTRGEWKSNGEAIKVALDGTLLDGQHRLLACIESEMPFECLVVTGLPNDVQMTMDGGLKRIAADRLGFLGETNTNTLATALRILIGYENDGTFGVSGNPNRMITDQMMIAALERHPGIRAAVSWATSYRIGALTTTQAAVLRYIMSTGVHHDRVDEFFEKLKNGAMLAPRDPILLLRNQISNTTQTKLGAARVAALVIKAWNAYICGRELGQLRWSSTEEFPRIMGSGVSELGYEALFTAPEMETE